MGKALYFKSYRKALLWYSGILLFFLTMAISFLGYTLPFGQMSLWGATVITNLVGVIFPSNYIDFTLYAWGGNTVGVPTLKRFYTLHFLLPIVLLGFIILHLYLLHLKGSTNPLGIGNTLDSVRFYPKYITKDIFGFFTLMLVIVITFFLWNPLNIADSDNFMDADFVSTPKHITPEWYFLPFYAMLRSIPNKLIGVCIMFFSIICLLFLPFIPFKNKSSSLSTASQYIFWSFVFNFIFLGWVGAHSIIYPYTIMCWLSTFFYFFNLLVLLPFLYLCETYILSIK